MQGIRVASKKTIEAYWKNVVGNPAGLPPWFDGHRILERPNFQKIGIPLAVHIDAGTYTQKGTNTKSVEVVQWSSELGEGFASDVPSSEIIYSNWSAVG